MLHCNLLAAAQIVTTSRTAVSRSRVPVTRQGPATMDLVPTYPGQLLQVTFVCQAITYPQQHYTALV